MTDFFVPIKSLSASLETYDLTTLMDGVPSLDFTGSSIPYFEYVFEHLHVPVTRPFKPNFILESEDLEFERGYLDRQVVMNSFEKNSNLDYKISRNKQYLLKLYSISFELSYPILSFFNPDFVYNSTLLIPTKVQDSSGKRIAIRVENPILRSVSFDMRPNEIKQTVEIISTRLNTTTYDYKENLGKWISSASGQLYRVYVNDEACVKSFSIDSRSNVNVVTKSTPNQNSLYIYEVKKDMTLTRYNGYIVVDEPYSVDPTIDFIITQSQFKSTCSITLDKQSFDYSDEKVHVKVCRLNGDPRGNVIESIELDFDMFISSISFPDPLDVKISGECKLWQPQRL